MLKSLCFLWSLLAVIILSAQTPPCDRPTYTEFINKGQALVTTGDYIEAFRYYNSAKDYCPQEAEAIDDLMESLVGKIEADRQQAQKLVDAFYFYEERFALAYKNEQFYFIDKNGDEVEKLGTWGMVQQFDATGYAKVGYNKLNYLLDTFGQKFPIAYTLETLDSTITALDLRGHRLDSFPVIILQHPQLKLLFLDGNANQPNQFIIPENINVLSELQSLQMSQCQISVLPKNFGQLNKLTHLDLSDNQLINLPKSIGQLNQLTSLSLSRNQLIEVPESVGQLEQLTSLNLSRNQLIKVPESIWRLKRLTSLNLSVNQLINLSDDIGLLVELTELSLSSNQLITIPKSIGQLTKLTRLGLSRNELTIIPESISQLTNLIELYLYSNELTSIPESIWQLDSLKTLYLSNNTLTTISKNMSLLSRLDFLVLDNTSLSYEQLNQLIAFFPTINTLYLGNLGLSELPPSVYELKHLKQLELRNHDESFVGLNARTNNFSTAEQTRIKERLPGVEILF